MLFTLLVSKLAIKIACLLKRDISIGGRIADFMHKDILASLKKKFDGEIIFIVGTNGKTTTRNMLVEIFNKDGLSTGNNHHSRDDYHGVISAFIEKSRLLGKTKVDYMILEIKDIATLNLLNSIVPNYLIITNLFAEQMSRKGSFKEKKEELRNYLLANPDTTMIFNGDDPVVVDLGMDMSNRIIYYGIDSAQGDEEAEEKECFRCGGTLKYSYINYSQLGDYKCESCGLERPEIDYLAKNVSLKDGIYFDLNTSSDEYPFDLPSQGYHNIYNILAVLTLLDELDIGIETGELALEEINMEDIELDTYYIKKPIFLQEVDSIQSFEQGLETIDEDEGKIDILFVFNDDREKNEEEITFIYDQELNVLDKHNVGKIYITGDRAYDLALCIRYMTAAARKVVVEMDEDSILHQAIGGKGEKLYIIAKGEADQNIEKQLVLLEKKWSRKK